MTRIDQSKSAIWFLLMISLLLSGCAPKQPALPKELVLYEWKGDMPRSVLDRFTAEYGIQVRYEVYGSQEEAEENMRAGEIYDVVVMDSRFIPHLVNEGMLAKLDYQNIPNFKNVSPNFRGLAYDPENQYSIPFGWGTIGLIQRTDLAPQAVTRWADLWDFHYAGKVGLWSDLPRETLSATLKSLGHSANSENPADLEAALAQLIALKPNLRFLNEFDPGSAAPALASGDVVIAMGYLVDFFASQEMGLPVKFILPEDGALMGNDNWVVPANSHNKTGAQLFINFLLRPEISAEIVNQKRFAVANEAAGAYIDLQILGDPNVYPDNQLLENAEVILPLSIEGQALYDEMWQRFLEANPK
jgi:spermidine/putrescine transport system substrate-binding protein